ncbi:hypothetical protein C8R44DRAFT_741540 [Mycena epipterygia]|nr:hypothetical protein C8R44DRAFT_741540 [Mycena epipterygia]
MAKTNHGSRRDPSTSSDEQNVGLSTNESLPYVPSRSAIPLRQPENDSMLAEVGDSLRSEATSATDRMQASSELSSVPSAVSRIRRTSSASVKLTQESEAERASDSSRERASVNARLSSISQKASPAGAKSKVSADTGRRPSSASSNWRRPADPVVERDDEEILVERRSISSRSSTSAEYDNRHASPKRDSVDITRAEINKYPGTGSSGVSSRHSKSSSRNDKEPGLETRSNTPSAHTARESSKSGSIPPSGLMSSSPYPEPEAVSLTASEKAERREGKRRRNRAESIESAEMKLAAKLSLEDQRGSDSDRSGFKVVSGNVWDPHIEGARAALARARGENETHEEFQRRRAALARSEARLQEGRVEDDRILAQEIYENDLRESVDRELAEQIAREEADNERRIKVQQLVAQRAIEREELAASEAETQAAEKRADVERRKQIILEYNRRELEKARAKTEELAQRKEAHSRASSRAATPSITVGSSNVQQSKTKPKSPSVVSVSSIRPLLAKPTSIHEISDDEESIPVGVKLPAAEKPRVVHDLMDRVIIQRYRLSEIEANGHSYLIDQNVDWNSEGQAYETGPAPSRGSSVASQMRSAEKRRTRDVEAGVTPAVDYSPHPTTPMSSKKDNRGRAGMGVPPAVKAKGSETPSPASCNNDATKNRETDNRSAKRSRTGDRPLDDPVTEPIASKTTRQSKLPRSTLSPIKEDAPFYMRKGTAPVNFGAAPDGEPGGSEPSDDADEGDKSSGLDDETYQPEYAYSREEDTDSAWEEKPSELISEITEGISSGGKPARTRSGADYQGAGGDPSDESPSSSESGNSNASAGPSKGPARTPRKNPSESERDRRRRLARNSRRNHHSHGTRVKSPTKLHLVEPGDPVSAGIPRKQQEKWRKSLHAPFKRAGTKPPETKEAIRQMDEDEGPIMAVMNRDGIKRKLYQLVKKERPAGQGPESKPAWKTSRPLGRDGGVGGAAKKVVPAHIKCFNCGGNHYKGDCDQPRQENMRGAHEEEAQEGSQAAADESSDDYTLKEFSDYGPSDHDGERVGGIRERFGHLREKEATDMEKTMSEYLVENEDSTEECEVDQEGCLGEPSYSSKEDMPHLIEESDVESDAELYRTQDASKDKIPVGKTGADLPSKSDANSGPSPMKIRIEPELFGTCDEYPDYEFIGEKDLDKLAKKMAKHVIWQGDTEEVEEFLFATGDLSSLSTQGPASDELGAAQNRSKKIGLKCEDSLAPPSPEEAGQSRKIIYSKTGLIAVTMEDSEDEEEEILLNMERPAQFEFPVLLEDLGDIVAQDGNPYGEVLQEFSRTVFPSLHTRLPPHNVERLSTISEIRNNILRESSHMEIGPDLYPSIVNFTLPDNLKRNLTENSTRLN